MSATTAPYLVNEDLHRHLEQIARTAVAIESLWDAVRANISVACKGEAECGTFGPVSGLDWAIDELMAATTSARRYAKATENAGQSSNVREAAE